MSDDPLEYIAGYVSPLTDKEHAQIGRIAVLWGQIEYFIDQLLEHVSGMTWEELTALGVADKSISAKVNWLDRIKRRVADEDTRSKIGNFCAIIHETKTDRNHVFHGIWGWRADDRTKKVTPAARKSSNPGQPFLYTRLPALEKKLCRCSRMGADLCNPLWHPTARPMWTKYVHHGVKGGAPEWMKEWSARTRVSDDVLDQSSKAVQLPRPKRLFVSK